jgi:hypothetical protein
MPHNPLNMRRQDARSKSLCRDACGRPLLINQFQRACRISSVGLSSGGIRPGLDDKRREATRSAWNPAFPPLSSCRSPRVPDPCPERQRTHPIRTPMDRPDSCRRRTQQPRYQEPRQSLEAILTVICRGGLRCTPHCLPSRCFTECGVRSYAAHTKAARIRSRRSRPGFVFSAATSSLLIFFGALRSTHSYLGILPAVLTSEMPLILGKR